MPTEAAASSEPEFYSYRTWAEVTADPRGIDGVILDQRAEGATFNRVTEEEDGVWVEGWTERPPILPDFNPPMTLTPPQVAA